MTIPLTEIAFKI